MSRFPAKMSLVYMRALLSSLLQHPLADKFAYSHHLCVGQCIGYCKEKLMPVTPGS